MKMSVKRCTLRLVLFGLVPLPALSGGKGIGLMDANRVKGYTRFEKKQVDVWIQAPSESTPEVQELHLPIYHAICERLEERFFG